MFYDLRENLDIPKQELRISREWGVVVEKLKYGREVVQRAYRTQVKLEARAKGGKIPSDTFALSAGWASNGRD